MILILIAVYLLSSFISNYTLLSGYGWYNDLAVKLYCYTGQFKGFLQRLYYFKLFTCKSCNVFWISLLMYFGLSYFMVIDYTVYALITFLIHKVENTDV